MIEEMYKHIARQCSKDDCRMVHRSGYFPTQIARQSQPYYPNATRLQYLPFIFTNDEALLFMLKLKYTNEILKIRITHVFTPNDLK